jgi:cytochrome P450
MTLMLLLQRRYSLPSLFYLDLWPAAEPMLIVAEPKVAQQISQSSSFNHHPIATKYLGNLAGSKGLFTAEGAEWKSLRAMFNPGFAPSHISRLGPKILEHVLTFQTVLAKFEGSTIAMADLTTNLAIDVIGEVVLGQDFKAQTNPTSPIPTAFKRATTTVVDSFRLWGKLKRGPLLWWQCRKLDRLIGDAVSERYDGVDFEKKEAIIDLALGSYATHTPNTQGESDPKPKPQLDHTFKRLAVDNVKTFLLAGHDGTASTLAYCYYALIQHPDLLTRIRAEYDQVFDPSPTTTIEKLRKNFQLLNKLPLTTAVIKETLRMYPTAAAVRQAPKDTFIEHDGKRYPTGGHLISISHNVLHHQAHLFPEPHQFIPERFLPTTTTQSSRDYGTVDPNAYRPFERGPRNCIGQELVMFETKMVLLLTLREFDFELMYGTQTPKLSEELGGHAYQVQWISARPNEGMPLRVTTRSQERGLADDISLI